MSPTIRRHSLLDTIGQFAVITTGLTLWAMGFMAMLTYLPPGAS